MVEKEFYKYFGIESTTILSDCQYENEYRCGICYGDDVCDYTEDDNIKCKNCEKSKPKYEYYPSITYDVISQLLWVCPVTHNQSFNLPDYENMKDDILQHVMDYFKNDTWETPKFRVIRNILNIHIQEMTRW